MFIWTLAWAQQTPYKLRWQVLGKVWGLQPSKILAAGQQCLQAQSVHTLSQRQPCADQCPHPPHQLLPWKIPGLWVAARMPRNAWGRCLLALGAPGQEQGRCLPIPHWGAHP